MGNVQTGNTGKKDRCVTIHVSRKVAPIIRILRGCEFFIFFSLFWGSFSLVVFFVLSYARKLDNHRKMDFSFLKKKAEYSSPGGFLAVRGAPAAESSKRSMPSPFGGSIAETWGEDTFKAPSPSTHTAKRRKLDDALAELGRNGTSSNQSSGWDPDGGTEDLEALKKSIDVTQFQKSVVTDDSTALMSLLVDAKYSGEEGEEVEEAKFDASSKYFKKDVELTEERKVEGGVAGTVEVEEANDDDLGMEDEEDALLDLALEKYKSKGAEKGSLGRVPSQTASSSSLPPSSSVSSSSSSAGKVVEKEKKKKKPSFKF